MPSNTKNLGFIDLTGDDDPSRSGAQARPSSQQASSSTKKSATDFLRRDAKSANTVAQSQRLRNGFVSQVDLLSSPTNGSNHNGNNGEGVGTNTQQSSRLSTAHSQPSQNRRAGEGGVNPSILSRSTDQSSQKSAPQSITIDSGSEDEGGGRRRRPPKEFVMPRDYEPSSTSKSLNNDASLDSPFRASSANRRKRSPERDSLLNGGSPFKRLKSSQRDSGRGSRSGSHSDSLETTNGQTKAAGQRRQESPKSRISGLRDMVDLVSPEKQKSRGSPPALVESSDRGSSQRSKSPLSSRNDPSTSATKRSKLSSNVEKFSQSFVSRQRDRSNKGSPDLVSSSVRSDAIPIREQRNLGRGLANAANGGLSARDASGSPPSQLDSAANRRTATPKIDSSAAKDTKEGRDDSQTRRSGRRKDRRRSKTSPDLDSPNRNHHKHNDLMPGFLAKESTPTSATRLSRKTSSQEDQGYGSLSSESADNRRRKSRKAPEWTLTPEKAGRKASRSVDLISEETLNTTDHGNSGEVAANGGSADKKFPEGESRRAPLNASPRFPTSEQDAASPAISSGHLNKRVNTAAHSPVAKSRRNLDIALGSGDTVTEPTENSITPTPKEVLTQKVSTEAEEADFQLRSEAMQSAFEKEVAAESRSVFAAPTISASALKASSMYSNLPLANRVEKVLGRYLEELRGDNEYWTSVSMQRARLTREEDRSDGLLEPSDPNVEELTSFAQLQPVKLVPIKKGSPSAKSGSEVWGIQKMAVDGKPQPLVEMSGPFTTFATDKQDVPDYAHYVSIKNNLLAPNVIHLHCWPYFGDEFDMSKANNLEGSYKIDIVERERKLLLLLKAQKYEDYVESALHDLDCSWSDVLRFLLELSPNVGSDLDARKAYQNRPQYCQEDFSRTSDRWVDVLENLPPSTPEKLGRVAVLCENFQKLAKFSLWHIARKSEPANLPGESDTTTEAKVNDNELTCRICLRFNCPYHGQFKHLADDSGSESDEDSVGSVDDVVATDIIHPLKTNYRSRIAFPPESPTTSKNSDDVPIKKKQKDPNYWSNYSHKAEDRGPFYPCHHPGTSCENAKCRCFERNIPCEKSCSCAPNCPRKFKGCSCGSKKGHRLVCFEDADCACWQLGRECDPDLCGACGVCDVVDPVNKYNDGILIGKCRNASIQRGVPKHTLLGDSGVHGLGLYACENIKVNDFVGEYKGEIITKKEADRRGAVYEHQKLSYLFSLNKSQEIDSTYFGNKVRFINHAHGEKANLYPRIIMVNTVHRIALYAGKDILAGKELLFDYGPYFPNEQLQGKKSKKSVPPDSKKSAPHVRNANLVKEFFDVEESEDEDGILRAKAVSHTAAGAKGHAKSKKPRGGARNGAGRKPHGQKAAHQESLEDAHGAKDLGQDAGERLAAFNISDDIAIDAMDLDAEGGSEYDEAFEPEGSDSDDSEVSGERSGESERSDFDEDDEEGIPTRPGARSGAIRRRLFRRG